MIHVTQFVISFYVSAILVKLPGSPFFPSFSAVQTCTSVKLHSVCWLWSNFFCCCLVLTNMSVTGSEWHLFSMNNTGAYVQFLFETLFSACLWLKVKDMCFPGMIQELNSSSCKTLFSVCLWLEVNDICFPGTIQKLNSSSCKPLFSVFKWMTSVFQEWYRICDWKWITSVFQEYRSLHTVSLMKPFSLFVCDWKWMTSVFQEQCRNLTVSLVNPFSQFVCKWMTSVTQEWYRNATVPLVNPFSLFVCDWKWITSVFQEYRSLHTVSLMKPFSLFVCDWKWMTSVFLEQYRSLHTVKFLSWNPFLFVMQTWTWDSGEGSAAERNCRRCESEAHGIPSQWPVKDHQPSSCAKKRKAQTSARLVYFGWNLFLTQNVASIAWRMLGSF